jgi:hypothetical protein
VRCGAAGHATAVSAAPAADLIGRAAVLGCQRPQDGQDRRSVYDRLRPAALGGGAQGWALGPAQGRLWGAE